MTFEWNTIHGALEALFPRGTTPTTRGYERCPQLPTSLFAAAAYLLERGGVYHRIIPESGYITRRNADDSGPPFDWLSPNFLAKAEDVERYRRLGERWYQKSLAIKVAARKEQTAELNAAKTELLVILNEVGQVWQELIECHELPIVQRPLPQEPLKWWLPALKLLILADEASRDLGYEAQESELSHPLEDVIRAVYDPSVYRIDPNNQRHLIHASEPTTFAPFVNTHLARVVPKSRTPLVGCTMRTLSHNLALVPPEGIVDVGWYRELRPFPEDREPLNLLLIPFPYKISATAFRPIGQNAIERSGQHRWGWFHIDQTWLRKAETSNADASIQDVSADDISRFVLELLKSAENDVGRIHGIILPELSLNWNCYTRLLRELQNASDQRQRTNEERGTPIIDFLVAGLSSNELQRRGNFVATTTFSVNDERNCIAATYRRAKHHRWQLTGSQISDYAIGSALDPNVVWWEANEIPKREISLTVFRRGAIFSAMICEDLARSEPCHEPLRSVGPNLVFVLLMDGPQLPGRWASRYATSLADDPGSSVLTLTSLGLMERANNVGRYPPCRNIGIWKDDSGHTVQIECPRDAQAVLITLSGTLAEESTLDGRPNNDTQAWRYRGHQPVRLPSSFVGNESASWIVRNT